MPSATASTCPFSGGDIGIGDDVEASDTDYIGTNIDTGAFSPGFPTDHYQLAGMGWLLIDFNISALSSDHLPLSALSSKLFEYTRFILALNGTDRPNVELRGTLTSTPIPPALPLFAAAIGGVGVVGWQRGKAKAVV